MRCSAQQEKHRCMATTHGCCAIGLTGYTGYCQSHKWRMKPKRQNLAFSIVSSLCSLLRILLARNISCLSIKFRKFSGKKQIAKLFVIVESKTFHSVSAIADISSFKSVENVHDFQNFQKLRMLTIHLGYTESMSIMTLINQKQTILSLHSLHWSRARFEPCEEWRLAKRNHLILTDLTTQPA